VHQIPPGDERVEELATYVAERQAVDNSDKDLTAEFRDAEAAFVGGAPNVLAEAAGTFDGAIMQAKANSAQVVAERQKSKEQRLATAIVDEQTARGFTPQPASPVIDEPDIMEADDAPERDFYVDDAGSVWEFDEGQFSRVESEEDAEAAEEEPADFPDQWRNDGLSSNEFDIDLTDDNDDVLEDE
jgi:hypothetical protein